MTGLFVKLDVEYASDDKMIEAGPMAELLYVRGLAFCKKNSATDGRISTAQLAVVAVGIPGAKRAAVRLVDVGAWVQVDKGWIVNAWLKRNRSGADIQAQAEMASALGAQGNHERWHVGPDGKASPKCSLCIGLHRQTRSGKGSGNPIGGSSPEVEEETEEEVEPKEESEVEEETELSSSSRYSRAAPAKSHDDDEMIDWLKIKDALAIAAKDITLRKPRDDAYSYERAINLDRERLEAIRVLAQDYPLLDAGALAAMHLTPPIEAAPKPVNEAWYADPTCRTCGGDGWDSYEGYVEPCSCRQDDPYIASVTPLRPA